MPKLSPLLARTITGIVYISIILASIISNSVTLLGWVLAALAAGACYEYQNIVGINRHALMLKIIHALTSGLLLYVAYAGVQYGLRSPQLLVALLPYLAYYLFYTIGEIYRKRVAPFNELAHAFFAHIYIAMPMAMLLLLSMGSEDVVPEALSSQVAFPVTFWALPIFVFTWLNDTGAYVVGSLVGRTKLFERISPKKTWEGTLGGIFFAMLGGWVFSMLLPGVLPLMHWIILALLVSLFATLGDLFESFLKRVYGVKDSGKVLPGHGGILDRIDSILFASIPAYIYIHLVYAFL